MHRAGDNFVFLYCNMARWNASVLRSPLGLVFAKGVGGALGFDGAMQLLWLHVARVALIAGVIPGQKIEDSVLEIMEVTPWCAECKDASTSSRREGGIIMRSLYKITSSIV